MLFLKCDGTKIGQNMLKFQGLFVGYKGDMGSPLIKYDINAFIVFYLVLQEDNVHYTLFHYNIFNVSSLIPWSLGRGYVDLHKTQATNLKKC